jgi:putative endonuclease
MSTLGKRGEDLVAAYYQKLGFKVLSRNFIFPHGKQRGELDLIVIKNKELVFVEVKARRNERFGTPFESVDLYKQRKLVVMVKMYLQQHRQYYDYNYRIDVAAVDIDNKDNPVIILTNAIEDID